MSRPANWSRRARTRPGYATRPITASIVTLLPDPDSPTMPSTSPSLSERLTPSTACITAACEGNSTCRSSISSRAIALSLELGIERVAQPVAQQVECEHGDQDHDSRKSDDPPGAQHEFAGVGQHRAPFGRRWLRAQPEKAQC